jgi:hypothetical protein
LTNEACAAAHVQNFCSLNVVSKDFLGKLSTLEGIVPSSSEVDFFIMRGKLVIVLGDIVLGEVSVLNSLLLKFFGKFFS